METREKQLRRECMDAPTGEERKDIPYLLHVIDDCRRERDEAVEWIKRSLKLHEAAADALTGEHGDEHRELVADAREMFDG